MYLNMNDFVPLMGPQASLEQITGHPQMFGMADWLETGGVEGMGDFLPGGQIGPFSPLESIYGHPQMFGMGAESDLSDSLSELRSQIAETKAKTAEARSRLEELAAGGAQVVKDVVGGAAQAVQSQPVAAGGIGLGTLALVGGALYLWSKRKKG